MVSYCVTFFVCCNIVKLTYIRCLYSVCQNNVALCSNWDSVDFWKCTVIFTVNDNKLLFKLFVLCSIKLLFNTVLITYLSSGSCHHDLSPCVEGIGLQIWRLYWISSHGQPIRSGPSACVCVLFNNRKCLCSPR